MIRFTDGPAANVRLMLRRAPLYLRVVFDAVNQKWDALDQIKDTASAGEVIFVYHRIGEANAAMVDWTVKRRRVGSKVAMAMYKLAAVQPDDATARDTAKWQAWCWAQVKPKPSAAGGNV